MMAGWMKPAAGPGCGCRCVRSSPVTSGENYALKIAAGYVLHPSHENDSYYFLLRL
jgi:hypothetical protein